MLRRRAEQVGDELAHLPLARASISSMYCLAAAALAQVAPQLLGERVGGRARERSERAGVQVREPLEHREERPRLLERHSTTRSTGAWSDRTRAAELAPLERPRRRAGDDVEVADEDVVDARAGPENPHPSRVRSSRVRERAKLTLKSPATATGSPGCASPST